MRAISHTHTIIIQNRYDDKFTDFFWFCIFHIWFRCRFRNGCHSLARPSIHFAGEIHICVRNLFKICKIWFSKHLNLSSTLYLFYVNLFINILFCLFVCLFLKQKFEAMHSQIWYFRKDWNTLLPINLEIKRHTQRERAADLRPHALLPTHVFICVLGFASTVTQF